MTVVPLCLLSRCSCGPTYPWRSLLDRTFGYPFSDERLVHRTVGWLRPPSPSSYWGTSAPSERCRDQRLSTSQTALRPAEDVMRRRGQSDLPLGGRRRARAAII